jgi:hypothetical protein
MRFKINHVLIEITRQEKAQTRVQVRKLNQGMLNFLFLKF